MNKNNLRKANILQEEIREIDSFILNAESVWTGKFIKNKYVFKTNSYGVFKPKKLELNNELKNRMLNVVKEYKAELEKELENL